MTRIFLFSILLFSTISFSQKLDVSFYDLNIDFDIDNKFIKGSNKIYFKLSNKSDSLKFNLFQNFHVDSVLFLKSKLKFKHINNEIIIYLNKTLEMGNYFVEVFYRGSPIIASNPPWDGGFVWKKDSFNNHWVGVACQGEGASLWWPCHDKLFDEPDSIKFSATVPNNLMFVSNGNLILKKDTLINSSKKKLYVWKNSYPINHYNITANIADYKHFSDTINGVEGVLCLDYYVLKENYDKAINHFNQVKPMLNFFEKKFGPFPFYSDGYKLVESPYLGMEHQTCIAYGNQYKKGYLGNYPTNIDFDFIIIHETAHEWWGNNVSMGCKSDMWIHEAFATYAEALYVEEFYGHNKMITYLDYQKQKIKNKEPIKSEFFSSTDMYYKGSWMLHTLRTVFNNDDLWFRSIKDLQINFGSKIIDTDHVIKHFESYSGFDLNSFFNQYLYNNSLPILEYYFSEKKDKKFLNYRWNSKSDINLPILIKKNKNNRVWINPQNNWRKIEVENLNFPFFEITESLFLVEVIKIK